MRYKYHILIASFILSSILWISLNLNQIYEIQKNLPVKIQVNKPYAVSGNIPVNLEVKFKGVGWSLIRLFTSLNMDFNYDIIGKDNDKIVIATKQYLNDNLGLAQNLTITDVEPESLVVRVDRYQEKYVKVIPRVYAECKNGYQTVGKPVIEPDSIKIGGAASILNSLKFIYTQELRFTNINSNINGIAILSDSLSNITWRSQNEVNLHINVELSADKEFQNVEIFVPNTPADKEVLLIPQIVGIQVKGGVNQLAALDNSKIQAMVDFNQILRDTTGSVLPKFALPEGVTIISVKPEKIQYVIKKKNE